MRHKVIAVLLLLVFGIISLTPAAAARNSLSVNAESEPAVLDDPAYCTVAHRIGKISLSVSNNANIGMGWPATSLDCITGAPLPSCEYPIDSDLNYLFAGALWIGAIVGTDTLVSTGADGWSCDGAEYRPDQSPFGDMIYRSTRLGDEEAKSEEDYVAVYYDTFSYYDPNAYWGIQHRPLNLQVIQKTYAWSYPYADDFVLFEYEVKNIGSQSIDEVCLGLYVDGDVGHISNPYLHEDDIAGFYEYDDVPMLGGLCDYRDTVNMAWIADNNGDPTGGAFGSSSCTGVSGVRLVRFPIDQTRVSFNWWVSNGYSALDFGPREQSGVGVWPEDFRDFGTGGLGTPEGDRNKYYMLRNGEQDYDQIHAGEISPADPIWMYPNQEIVDDIVDGFDTRYLLSFGILDEVEPGEKFPVAVAYVAGENFHTDPNNLVNIHNDPDLYYDNLDFSDFVSNGRWAERVYDNPGVDTDQDGYFGRAIDCGDTLVYVEGDGVPDYCAAVSPRAPRVWGEWRAGESEITLNIRWNGGFTETTSDIVSGLIDFEGYRVYMSIDGTPGSYALVGAYDVGNYLKYIWDAHAVPEPDWRLIDAPFTLEELRCLYGSSCGDVTFNPLDYTSGSPYVSGDSLFYFTAFGDNTTLAVAKVYPDQPYPSSLNRNLADPSELTEDRYFKYFEYELNLYGIDHVNDACHYINVTGYDYGWPATGVIGLESDCEHRPVNVCFPSAPYGPAQEQKGFTLGQNHPNPFNPVTKIEFNLPKACQVKLEVFNIVGQRVAKLVDRKMEAGYHVASFDGSELATGAYLYRLCAGDFVETKRMMLVK